MKRTKHYVQDAGEKYFVYVCVLELHKRKKLNTFELIKTSEKEFKDYVRERNCMNEFNCSSYKKTYDLSAPKFVEDLVNYFGDSAKFDIRDVEKAARNAGKKADFRIDVFNNGSIKKTFEQSLKCYESSSNIQLCSGTFLSTPLSILFERKGPGKFLNPVTNEVFSSSNINKLEEAIDSVYPSLKEDINKLRLIQKDVEVWKTDPTKKIWKNITYTDSNGKLHSNENDEAWNAFCEDIGNRGKHCINAILKKASSDQIKKFFSRMLGVGGDEELLILFNNGVYINSLTNKSIKNIFSAFSSKTSKAVVSVDDEKKGITIQLVSDNKKILMEAYIPTTINRNGMWQLDPDHMNGRVLTSKKYKGMLVPFGHIRPDKLEIATSTNCWVDIMKYIN